MDILTRYRGELINGMTALLGEPPPSPIADMCRYQVGLVDANGLSQKTMGKMIRPALCLAVCDALGGRREECVPAALAIELLHRTSLVFDDIQDHSPERNHRPTLWRVWGTDQALNGGLALSCFARLALHVNGDGSPPEVHRVLEWAVIDLCRGQYMDLHFQTLTPSLEEYLEMVRLKTGVLLGTACEVGALVAGADGKRAEARRFGESLGVAFQMWDDYLGVWGSTESLGKVPSDLVERKRSLPVVLAIRANPDEVGRLLGISRENRLVPSALYQLLDRMAIREVACAEAVEASRVAVENLRALDLDSSWQEEIQGLAEFVVAREA